MGVKLVTQRMSEDRLRRDLNRRLESRRDITVGVLVGVDYTDKPDVEGRPGYVWVREYSKDTEDFGGVVPVFAGDAVEYRLNLSVFVAASPTHPWKRRIIGVDWSMIADNTDYGGHSFGIGPHAPTHTYIPGRPTQDYSTDPVDVTTRNIIDFRVYPTGPTSMRCRVVPGCYMYGASVKFFAGGTTADFTAAIPAAANRAVIVYVCVDGATNALAYQYSDEFVWTTWTDPIPSSTWVDVTPGYVLCGTPLLYNGMGAIIERCFTYDRKPIFQVVGSGAVLADAMIWADVGGVDTPVMVDVGGIPTYLYTK